MAKRRSNTVSNFQRQRQTEAALAARVHPLDRAAGWIGRRSRFVRTLICGWIALIFTVGTALILYRALYRTDPRKLTSGVLTLANLPWFVFIFLAVLGYAFYWAGWRVLIGFDFDDHPLQPGRAAAVWVLFGAVLTVMFVMGVVYSAVDALQP